MAFQPADERDLPLRFDVNEATGALGDTITVLPLVVALALLTEISLPHVLLAFGIFQIVWGVAYGLPLSVEPMKALAALAIAGTLTYAELALAGIVLGVVLLAIGITGALSRIRRWIGEPVVRGVQLAVALLLLEMGYRLAADDPGVAVAGIALVALVLFSGVPNLSALVVLGVGFGLAAATVGLPSPRWPGAPPVPALTDVRLARTADGVVAQLAMTIGNAALATSLLVSDLFDREISPDHLSSSMGLTNLFAVPAGGIPMCHGCDGVAGKYEFGARTGGANVILGGGYVVAAFLITSVILQAFPLALLGILLGIVAVSLGRRVLQSDHLPLSVGIGVAAVITNLGIAFLLGILAFLAIRRHGARQ